MDDNAATVRRSRVATARRRFSSRARIILLATALGAAAATLVATSLATTVGPIGAPWPRPLLVVVVALGYFVAESFAIHIEIRSEAHSFSISEIPLVAGLLYLGGADVVLATTAGAVCAWGLVRRQSALKLGFNTAHVALSAAFAAEVFHLVAGRATEVVAPRLWIAAAAAAVVAYVTGALAISAAITLTEGRSSIRKLIEASTLGLLSAVASAALGILGIVVVDAHPVAMLLLAVPGLILLLTFRSYVAERRQHESLDFLNTSFSTLYETADTDQALTDLLSQAVETFRTRFAEVTLFPDAAREPMLRARARADSSTSGLVEVGPDGYETIFRDAVTVDGPRIVRPAEQSGPLADYLRHRGITSALVAPLQGETRVIGALVLADRVVDVSPFRDTDLRLFATLTTQISVALERGRLERSLSRLTELQHELRHQAFHDGLTGLANRTLFRESLEEALDASGDRPVAVVYLDLDEFKSINDTLGHDAGDALLQAVADRLRSEAGEAGLVARLGGDEFAVLLPDHDVDAARARAERLAGALRLPVAFGGEQLTTGASIGIAAGRSGDDAAEVIRRGDVAMYTAKRAGRGRIACHDGSLDADLDRRARLASEFTNAIVHDELVPWFQPLVDMGSGRTVGFEALVRWEHPKRGVLSPDAFLDVAAEHGLLSTMDERVLERAAERMSEWRRRGHDLIVSVNLAAEHLARPNLVEVIRRILERTGLAPEALMLEVTEHAAMTDVGSSRTNMEALRALGVRLAIDDFGTGHSSLAYLRSFPIDVLKIAKPFVDDLDGDAGCGIARAIVELGRSIGVRTLAEGIESESQAATLDGLGCDLGQGYRWGAAVPAAEVDDLLDGPPAVAA